MHIRNRTFNRGLMGRLLPSGNQQAVILDRDSLSSEQTAQLQVLSGRLAQQLDVATSEVQFRSFGATECNVGHFGFPEEDAYGLPAFSEGIEVRLSVADESLVYRGTDSENGRFGLDVKHQGYWQPDQQNIYRPV